MDQPNARGGQRSLVRAAALTAELCRLPRRLRTLPRRMPPPPHPALQSLRRVRPRAVKSRVPQTYGASRPHQCSRGARPAQQHPTAPPRVLRRQRYTRPTQHKGVQQGQAAQCLLCLPPEVRQVRHTSPCDKGVVGQTDRPCPPRERERPARRRLLVCRAQVHACTPLPNARCGGGLGSWHTLTPAPREASGGCGIHLGTNQHYFAGSCPLGEGTVSQTAGAAGVGGGMVAATGLPAAGLRAGRDPQLGGV